LEDTNIFKQFLVFSLTIICLFGFNRKVAFAVINETAIEAEGYVNYDMDSNITDASGEVIVTHEKGVIKADQITYYGADGLLNAVGSVQASSNDGLVVEADLLNYDNRKGIAVFKDNVKLTSSDGTTITAGQITYCDTTGYLIASGGVEIIQKQNTYQTEAIEYNLQTHEGFSGSATCILDNKGARDIKLTGRNMKLTDEATRMERTVFTRCRRPKPEYFITASSIIHEGDRVKLWNSIVFLHGIPIFYIPYLSFRAGADRIPNLEPGYNSDDGFFVTYAFETPVENGHNWFFNGVYRTKDTSTYGVGLGLSKNNLRNRFSVKFNNPILSDDYWSVSNSLSYNLPLATLSLSGSREFNTSEETHYNLRLTGKKQDSPLGSWRLGILAEEITAIYRSEKYGGIYGGYRLDYYPNKYLTFSLIKVDPLSTLPGRDFEALLRSNDYSYRFGANWQYNIKIPFWKDYSFGLDGSYNSTQDLWIDRNYRITRDTCCFYLSFGWDDLAENFIFSWSISL
jgi:lipopolysaccharide export system protein LptA